jgi:DNA-binding CsgD family transcriptional regulator
MGFTGFMRWVVQLCLCCLLAVPWCCPAGHARNVARELDSLRRIYRQDTLRPDLNVVYRLAALYYYDVGTYEAYTEALRLAHRGLALSLGRKDHNCAFQFNYLIGLVYETRDQDHDEALEYLRAAQQVARRLRDTVKIRNCYYHITKSYVKSNRAHQALPWLDSLEVWHRLADQATFACLYYSVRARVYQGLQRHAEALRSFELAEQMGRRYNATERPSLLNDVYRDQGYFFLDRQDYARALAVSDKWKTVLDSGLVALSADWQKQRGLALAGLGRWEEAYKSLRITNDLASRNQSDRSAQELNRLRAQLGMQKKIQENELLSEQNKRSRLQLQASIGGLVLLAVALAGFYGWYRFRQRLLHTQLRLTEMKTREQDRELQMLALQNATLDQERRLHEQAENQARLQLEIETQQAREQQQAILHELTLTTLRLTERQATLEDLLDRLAVLKQEEETRLPALLGQLEKSLTTTLNTLAENHDELITRYEAANADFFTRLRQTYGEFSRSEIRLIVLSRIGKSIKDVATLLNIEPESVKMARYRLKKKLHLEAHQGLEEFLHSF